MVVPTVQTKRPDAHIRDIGPFYLYYCRQRPTLPYSFPYSTIGGSRLNFRVRNGNGCDPAPMTTGIVDENSEIDECRFRIADWKPACCSRFQRTSGSRTCGGRPARAPSCSGGRTQFRLTTEHPANGSFAKPPLTQRVLHARHDPKTMPYNGDVVADGFETVGKENMVKPHG
jgi:hypothetical protein